MLSLSQLQFLASPQAADLLAAELPDDPLAAQKLLRRSCDTHQATAVATLVELRRRARRSGRFSPEMSEELLATDKMLQQASSLRMASYVGAQLAQLGGEHGVLDLCCGMGVDAIGAAMAGARVRGVDLDERAVICARHNARVAGVAQSCTFEVADATAIALPRAGAIHIDPDRRATGRRTVLLEDSQPGPEFLKELPRYGGGGAMKLSPAMDSSVLDDWEGEKMSLEYVSEEGVCKQLIVWWGAGQGRKATTVFGDMNKPQSADILDDGLGLAPVREAGDWIIEPDPAVIAAGAVDSLARRCNLWRIVPSLAWLGGAQAAASPLARSYRILHESPGRERNVARAVGRLGGGHVQVKTRGVKLDTDTLQRRLRGKGNRPLVVLWYRTGPSQRAFIADPSVTI